MIKETLAAVAVVTLSLSLTACGGSSTKTTIETTETQGQQLIDLKEAYDKGVIDEKEYNKAKKEILKR